MHAEEIMNQDNKSLPEARNSASMLDLLRLRNFRLLWIGEAISLIGDQFYLIALPWLVLQLTGDGLIMGSVLALAGIPRALFILVGGAFTDRFSPKNVMLASNLLRMGLVILLAGLVLNQWIELWMLYLLALAFGLVDAFFYPAQSAIIPRLINKDQLQGANAIMHGTMQLSLFAGPVLAGYLIASIGQRDDFSASGIGLAFALDAFTFLASAATLWLIRDDSQTALRQVAGQADNLIQAIVEGVRIVWRDTALRAFFILIALSNFLVNGPIFVGIPILAAVRYSEGVAAYGIIMSAYGGGSLLGTLLAGLLPRPPSRSMGIILGIVWSGLGLGVLMLGLVSSTVIAAGTAAAMGIAQGYVVILFITWLQRRTDKALLGRMMSLLLLSSVGLQPISFVLTGALVGIDPRALFVTAGGLMIAIVFLFLLNPKVRSMNSEPIGQISLEYSSSSD